jgi:hypothetical protein
VTKAVSVQNSNLKDLPVLATKAGTIVVPLAGSPQTPVGLDYQAAPQVVSGGQADDATYCVSVTAMTPTAAQELITIEAFAATASLTGAVRIQRIEITQVGLQTTGAVVILQLLRTTSAGAGGAVTPTVMDPADIAYPGIARKAPTAGTESTVLFEIPVFIPAAAAAFVPIVIDLAAVDSLKTPVIAAGVANGIALKHPGAAGAAGFAARMWFTTV